MAISQKIKASNNKMEQKSTYDLDRQTAMISDLLSGNVNKYKFLTGKDILPEKDLLEKAVTMTGFEFSLLKSQTDIANKQCQKIVENFKFDKLI